MTLAIRWFLCAVLLPMAGCKNETSPSVAGIIRIDNTAPSGPCRITVVNESAETHDLQLLTDSGKALLDVEVPSRVNTRPPVWRMFHADVSGRVLSVTIDGKTNEVPLRKETVEVVISVGSPVGSDSVTQYSARIQWR